MLNKDKNKSLTTTEAQKYKINSGWVDEKFSENLQQLLLSERVLWTKGNTKLPIRINTKSVNTRKRT
jgi:hypothetical protein